jgi:Glycosyl hydrolases family 43
MHQSSIRPGQPWLDTGGHRIQAHGGSVHHEEGTFYWYGENKERTTPGSGIWHWGVRCYRSTDLYNWEDLGLIIPPEPDDPASPLHPAQKLDRPHIVRHPATGNYVCWLKVMGEGLTQTSTVLTAESLLGPYTTVRTGLRPLGMNGGDFDLVVDPVDGKGYHYFERVHSELICADLTEDLTAISGHYSTHFPRGHPPFVREAPAYFRRGDGHYMVTSGTTGYFPNPSEVAVAATYHGPWTVLGDPHPEDLSRTSFRSQVSSVFRHPAKQDLYIALADRWLPHLSADRSNREGVFRRMFEHDPLDEAELLEILDADDTSIADYVWLPFRFEGDMAYLDWRDDWKIEDFE